MSYAEDYLNLIKNSPVKIGHELGYTDLTDLHNEWIKKIIFSKEDYLLQAHRGSFKTTCYKVALPIICVALPDDNTLMMRKAEPDVIEIIKATEVALRHPLFVDMAYQFWDKLLKVSSTQTQIDTNLVTFDRGTPQLIGMGVNGSLTGKHFERIYTDDIVNLKDRISEAERRHTKIVYQELQNLRNRGGVIGNSGTPWQKDDAFSLMPIADKYDCYSTGLIIKEQLKDIRSKMTPSLFAANYELKHIADEDTLFTDPFYIDDEEKIHNGSCHIDAGYGGEDRTALTIMKAHGSKAVAYGKIWFKHVDDCLEEILLIRENLLCGTIHCETNADKGYLAKEIKKKTQEMFKKGLIASDQITVKTYHEKMNKDVKIKTHLYSKWNDIEWLESTDPEYMSQILDYTEHATHDDAPDSAASITRIYFNKTILNINPNWRSEVNYG